MNGGSSDKAFDAHQAAAFRQEIRRALHACLPADLHEADAASCLVTREQARRWQQIMHAQGWAAPSWPGQHGGPDWALWQLAIFREEYALAGCPRFENLGIDMIGPTLMNHGTPEQQAKFLPRILSFEDYWAQAYSEPDAGSDLASVKTTARRDGDVYVVNGTKIWQSFGHWANWALALVRTDPGARRKQDGLSVLLIDMTLPGVTVRPIRFINGAEFHVQLFFDEVRVPLNCLVGAQDAGWAVAKDLLVTERLFLARVGECKAELEKLKHLTRQYQGPPALARANQRAWTQLAQLECRFLAHESQWWQALTAAAAGSDSDIAPSLLKLQGTELIQDLYAAQMALIGRHGLPVDPAALDGRASSPPLAPDNVNNIHLHFLRYRGVTLGGGASEIQKEIIARVLFSGKSELDAVADADADEQQSMIDESLRKYLAREYSADARRESIQSGGARCVQAWAEIAGFGLLGLMAHEEQGGASGRLADVAHVSQTLAAHLFLPLYGTAAVAAPMAWAIAGAASTDAVSRMLVDTLAGHTRLACALEADPAFTARATQRGWTLTGTLATVLGGDSATHLLVAATLSDAPSAELGVFLLPAKAPGLARRAYRLYDARGAADLHFDAVGADAADLIVRGAAARAFCAAFGQAEKLLWCVENVGVMREALRQTVEYLGTRRQFGRPLSEFQALRHRVVDLYRAWRNAHALAWNAIGQWRQEAPEAHAGTVAAACWIGAESAHAVALDVLQLHGAIGLQDETAISHLAKRLLVNQTLLGGPGDALDDYIDHLPQEGA
ncbi:acyl-CoA dehydrogenase family protein [Achromobacter marplatensis]|uniref:acyl-CoA dehydrogenase family protein n=1 Tax=Achromobacter marplatensis TaxID=470868 RepID=UPI0039F70FE6